jgi:nitroimidazol reductase NimA-like FMN-containing flavoprotein (pyridoxamine 5'-phosphate oxidase superfamily)
MTSTWSRVEVLDRAEALRLLESVRWGRYGWSTPEGPRMLPVNYSVLDGNVYLRTELHGSIADASTGNPVAFEADELDDRLTSGWSVVVLGHAEQVEDPTEGASLFRRMREPWAPGSRPVLVRIVPTEITGRRFSRH